MKEITAYICDFCPRKKRFAQRGTALRHEGRCFHNPIRRACATCKHFSMEPSYSDPETGYREYGGPVCALNILPIDMGPENPPKTMTSECEKWEPVNKAAENSLTQIETNDCATKPKQPNFGEASR